MAKKGESKVVTDRFLNHSGARHPLATAEWEKEMKAAKMEAYTAAVQAYIRSKR